MGNVTVVFKGGDLAEQIKYAAKKLSEDQIGDCFSREQVTAGLAALNGKCKVPDEFMDYSDVADLINQMDKAGLQQEMADLANLAFNTDVFKVEI